MKKILALLLVLTMTMSMSSFVFAETGEMDNGFVEKTITYDEYIQALAKSLNVSIDEAKKIDKRENEKYERDLKKRHPELFETATAQGFTSVEGAATPLSSYSYITITKSKNYNPYYSAYVAADLKIYTNGSFREIVSLLGNVYSERESGWGNYEWNQLNSWDDPSGGQYPTISVTIGATGTFRVEVDSSIEVGAELAGFSLGGSVGGTDIYISDPMQITYTYSLY